MPTLRLHRRASSIARLLLVACLLAVIAWPVVEPVTQREAEAAFIFAPSDRIIAPPRGTPEKVLRFAQAAGASPMFEVRDFIYEVYRLAPLVGMDPSVIIAQSAHETANWTSFYWRNHLNPAGIGIYADGVPSYTWPDGATAARYNIVLLYIYAVGTIDPDNPLYPYRNDGPGYQVTLNVGYGGCCVFVDDLTGRWAVDPNYGVKIASKGAAIYSPSTTDVSDPGLLVQTVDASAGSNPNRARDGNLETSWAVSGVTGPPPGAYAEFDLGGTRRLTNIQWVFRRSGFADSFQIQVATVYDQWTTIGSFGNAPPRAWQQLSLSRNARWVRFLFANPNQEMTLGYLAEVDFFGVPGSASPTSTPYPTPTPTNTSTPTATATPTVTSTPAGSATATPTATATATPPITGSPLTIVTSSGSSGTTGSATVRDGDLGTVWRTTVSSPRQAHVFVDLGAVRPISAVQWQFAQGGGNAAYSVLVSNNRSTWTTIANRSGGTPGAWETQWVNGSARYVRLLFTNPANAPVVGYVAEMRVFGESAGGAATATPTPTATPSLTGDALPAASSGGSSATTGSRTVRDGSLLTVWQTTGGTPSRAHVFVDLGGVVSLRAIQWQFSQTGGNADYDVLVSTDKSTWSVVETRGGESAGVWHTAWSDASARYVRLLFRNPTGAPVLGYVAELRAFGSLARNEPPAATATPTIEPTATPVVTGDPLPVATSGGSSGTTGSRLVRDGSLATTWETTSGTPARAHVFIDLGGVSTLQAIQWQFGQPGGNADYDVLVSTDKVTWTVLETRGSEDAGVWHTTLTNQPARYVRLLFRNPTGAPVLGYVAELRAFGSPVTAATIEDVTPTPSETPAPTATPEATSTPEVTAEPTAENTAEAPATPEMEPTPAATSTPSPEPTPTGPPEMTPTPTPSPEQVET